MFDFSAGVGAYPILGWFLVFGGLILANEFARRSKVGGIICFFVIPGALTVFFIVLYAAAATGASWALANQTYVHMTSWFHYAKLYAATIGCIGFMFLKYRWGIGKTHWFKAWPFVIVAINILIAVLSDFECATHWYTAWTTSEHLVLYGGWWNILNAVAGLLNILCMTGWWGVYSSKKHDDMLWPDMTWVFIIAYDLWNFTYTYNCLPTHSWYCGLALLLAPTVAYFIWNRGGWIQNRAYTLALWCMFAQIFPTFQMDGSVFYAPTTLYSTTAAGNPDPTWNMVFAVIAVVANAAALVYIIYRARKLGRNPYKQEIFIGTSDYRKALARADEQSLAEFEAENGMKVSDVLAPVAAAGKKA